jgi:hypothetical protein
VSVDKIFSLDPDLRLAIDFTPRLIMALEGGEQIKKSITVA